MIKLTLILIFLTVVTHLCFTVLKRSRMRELLKLFRHFNDQGQDLAVLVDYITERNSALRLIEVLEYLIKIEEWTLAKDLYLKLPFDAWPARTARVLAIKVLRTEGCDEAATLAERLREAFPDDDSVLEIYVDTMLDLGRYDQAEKALMPRLERSARGTAFRRQQARLLAARGRLDEALALLEKVVDQDQRLYNNTIAPTQKGLLREQAELSQKLLDQLKGASD